MSSTGSERLVAALWERQSFRRERLATVDGRPVQVVYPGRRTVDHGPDFRGALIAVGGELLRGDVEVHVRTSGWREHGHQGDPAYGRVVLHVVLDHDGAPTERIDGAAVPVVALSGYLSAPLAQVATALDVSSPPPVAPCSTPEEAGALLDAAGLARFEERAAALEGELAWTSAEEVLYAGLLEAMGYRANKAPCRRLAERVPLATLRAELGLAKPSEGVVAVQGILLGAAGLLPSQRGRSTAHPVARTYEMVWARATPRVGPPMPSTAWQFFRVRPENTPPRRLAGLAYLLAGAGRSDLVSWLLAPLWVEPPEIAGEAIERALTVVVAEDGFWSRHYDFDRPTRTPRPALIGVGRARDALVSVVLPFAAALGSARDDDRLRAAALACYNVHPPATENELTRHMAHQLVGGEARRVVRSARRQQGLLHLYHRWCHGRHCLDCPAGGKACGAALPAVVGRELAAGEAGVPTRSPAEEPERRAPDVWGVLQ